MQNKQGEQIPTISMATFLQSLYSKYKVLSKLTDTQSELFQLQIISLLVNESQNVDPAVYRQIKSTIGVENLILDILGRTLERNLFSSQHRIHKNISSITQQLEAKAIETNKKAKVLSRKEFVLQKNESLMCKRIKDYAINIEKQLMKKLCDKELNLKKQLNDILNVLKNKERLISQRKKVLDLSIAQLRQLEERPPESIHKIRKQKIETGLCLKNNSTILKLTEENKVLKNKYDKKQSEVEEWKKKNRNSDLAYKKMKLQYENQKHINQDMIEKLKFLNQQDKIRREDRDTNSKENQNIQTTVQFGQNNLVELMQQLDISNIISTNNSQHSHKIFSQGKQATKLVHENESYFDKKLELFDKLDEFSEYSKIDKLLEEISRMIDGSQFGELIDSRLLVQFCKLQLCEQKTENIQLFYDSLLIIMMQTNQIFYQQILEYLSQPIFVSYFQQSYLNFESSDEICEATTLILSRVWMKTQHKLNPNQQFQKALKLRKRMIGSESEGMLQSNILFLHNLLSQ